MTEEEPKCSHCGTTKALGFVKTTSPTKSYSRDFRLCMPDIIDLERWLTNKPNVKGEVPTMVYGSPR